MTDTDVPAAALVLPDSLDIAQAAALHALLLPQLETPALSLGAGAVQRVHTAGVQVLASFVRTRSQAGRRTTWDAPSEILCRAAARLGLTALLGLPKT